MTAFRPAPRANGPPVRRSAPQSHRSSPDRYRTRPPDATVRGCPDAGDLPDLDPGVSVTTLGPTARGGLASILVPIAGGPNSDAVVDVAVDLARHWGASLQLLTVVSRSSDDAAWLQADARLHNYAGDIDGLPVDVGVCSRDDVVAAITERAQAHDLVVVGESDRSLFRRLFAGTIPERLAERSETPIFVVERGRRGNRDAR